MSITIIQVLIVVFALFALTRAILRLRDKSINNAEFFFWALIWVIVIVVALIPGILLGAANFLGIANGTSLIVYLSILLLFYLMFRVYVKIEGMDNKITNLVRNIGISEADKKKRKR